ncbi:MAG: aconitase/3-isopropylmalate dehydratase large subunit family protein [Candidatus Eisenbacteria bacterium]
MGSTLIEKIISEHAGKSARAGDVVDMRIDVRIARDFGGANVVKNIEDHGLGIDNPEVTFFTFDCNPTGSDQRYAANQQRIRLFAAKHNVKVYDITEGIGTHIAVDEGLVGPGTTVVSTDSHANIVGAVGAFGQGMGDQDIAHAFAKGRVWFRVPPTVRITIVGRRPEGTTAKDVTLALLQKIGAGGLLGFAAEVYGEAADAMDLSERITLASMATEMAGIIILFPPSESVLSKLKALTGKTYTAIAADADATYEREIKLDVSDLKPLVSLPGNPENVVALSEVMGTRIHSGFIGSCTNGRYEDMLEAAQVLEGRKVAPGVVLKIVPATNRIWRRCLEEGIIKTFKDAGALVGNAGCAGCAAGQVGQNGPGEITISTGNRNFPGKQGQGKVYLASPGVVAASAVRGLIATPMTIDTDIAARAAEKETAAQPRPQPAAQPATPLKVKGKVWVIAEDNIDTDMIYHNRHLAVTEISEMGSYCFGNLEGWKDFPAKVKPGDLVIVGSNFGCGSSRQHAVDCFKSLGVQAVIARSFGAIYERNAINAGLPIVQGDITSLKLKNGDVISVDFTSGEVTSEATGKKTDVKPFSDVQLEIYKRGGLLSG